MIQSTLYFLINFLAAVLMGYTSIFLFLRGGGNKARRMLGYTNMIWCIMFVVLVVCDLFHIKITNFPVFSDKTLLLSNFMICVMFLFPMEVLKPGWLTKKRLLLLFTPALVVTFSYFSFLRILNENIEELFSFDEMWASLGHFNVWYRFVLLCCNLAYCYILLHFIYHNQQKYQSWKENCFSDREEMDISWMRYYFKMIILLVLLYLILLIWGNQWFIIFNVVVSVVVASVLFYKGLFYESPYPKDFYQSVASSVDSSLVTEELSVEPQTEDSTVDYSFESQIPQYLQTLKTWMEKEKPYLYNDFKLTDAARVLPLNRTYLSRLFNEGLHQTFSEVVREYRIAYAKQLLKNDSNMAIYEVAKASGFTSDSSFIKAFQKVTGMTPRQYRLHEEM